MQVKMKAEAGLSLSHVTGNGDEKNRFDISQGETKEISESLFEILKDSLEIVETKTTKTKKEQTEGEN